MLRILRTSTAFSVSEVRGLEPGRVEPHASSGGGPTHFLDMRVAYDQLSERRRRELEGLRVAYAHNNGDAFPPRRAAVGPADALEDVTHPLVRTFWRYMVAAEKPV